MEVPIIMGLAFRHLKLILVLGKDQLLQTLCPNENDLTGIDVPNTAVVKETHYLCNPFN